MDAPVDPRQLEQRVLDRWRERDVSGEVKRRRAGAAVRVIWEQPAPAGVHLDEEVAARIQADVFARYATMRGWHVERRGARDCHDPALELATERGLGLASASAGTPHAVGEVVAGCREAALESAAALDTLGQRLGLHACAGVPVRTLDAGYVESVWWAVKELSDQGLLEESVEVQPYCPRCATPLQAADATQGHVAGHDAVVRFRVARDGGPLQAGDELLVAPSPTWTLMANAAVAADPEVAYVRVKTGPLEAPVVLAEALVDRVLGGREGLRVLARFRGAAIDGVCYEPPLRYLPAACFGDRGHTVLLADFVTATEDGA